MKLIKQIATSFLAASFVTTATAQVVTLHGYLDYTNMLLGQTFSKTEGAKMEHTDPAAEFGSFYNGRTELNCNVDASNFHFVLGVRLDASLGQWYENYTDVDDSNGKDGVATYFHQGNMRVDLLKQQLHIYTGKFEDWNCGYVVDGYVMEEQNISNIADKDVGQHFSGLEYAPYAVPGLKVLAGFPILPVSGNGVDAAEYNKWENLYKKIKIAASYHIPHGEIINIGFRPETHYEGTSKYNVDSYFGESFIQVNNPKLFHNFGYNASYDVRYRDYKALDKTVFMHYLGASAQLKLTDQLTVSAENRSAYAQPHYIKDNEALFYNTTGLLCTYDIPYTLFTAGLKLVGTAAKDSNGTLFNKEARIQGRYSSDFAMTTDWMPYAANITTGSEGTYYSFYLYPYLRRTFANGYVQTGIETQFTYFKSTDYTMAIGYRLPVALKFWF